MKHPSAYYLLLLYAFTICKPFLPVVQDVFAHLFWETEHVATVHQHHGRQHLQQELKEAARQDATDTNHSRAFESLPVHLRTHYQFDFACVEKKMQPFKAFTHTITTAFLEIQTPPPKA